ncbi:DUF6153 family protein [Actinomadura algeriensis]|uniref:Uncharacterized protein n=1 Tax=Actinomadura algeriensis TaxID=1679523 RepID=A0ABR9K4R7_9ACTN|nr:DUF6153 family protein [Actinomadura algeriensis]MBE1537827.1 hypothetical protein [Actinomadura algeriensis]
MRQWKANPNARRQLWPLALVFGVLLMHGVQASNSPVDASGVAVRAVDHAAGGMEHPAPDHDGGDHHPGGQVCLAFLGVLLLGAVACALVRWRLPAPAREAQGRALRAGFRTGRSPPCPSPFRLAVLRL